MNQLKKLHEGNKYFHGTVGNPQNFDGKVFIKDQIKASSCEISFGTLKPQNTVPFFHSHKENEEIYIILSGHGTFQVDDEVFPIEPGSIIRLATNCDRNLKNTSQQNMVYICIQARENSLKNYTMSDAEITERKSRL